MTRTACFQEPMGESLRAEHKELGRERLQGHGVNWALRYSTGSCSIVSLEGLQLCRHLVCLE